MPVPETTSAENLARYVGGKCLAAGRGSAWRDVTALIIALPSGSHALSMPSISEPMLTWITSGDIEIRERELEGPWLTSRVKKGSLFLIAAGAPYECHSKTLTAEPYECMFVAIGLPLLRQAFEEVFGANADYAQLKDVSAFEDVVLISLMERLREELSRRKASALYVQSVGMAIAVHMARNYAAIDKKSRKGSPSLPGYKLKRITNWMANRLAEEFNLDQLADQAGLSKFYFNRLFKSATGVSPSHYHTALRMEEARRLLRETKKSVVAVALELGYATPSHFAQVFRKETGLSPSDYRRQR